MKIQALAAYDSKAALAPFSYDIGKLDAHECIIKVNACGVCGTDLAMMASGRRSPVVPGHEIAGEVVEVGSAVERLKPGARVGVGWQSGACLECNDCLRGHENICDNYKPLILSGYGGF